MHETFHKSFDQQKGILSPNEIVEITYEEFISDPATTINNIYSALDLNNSTEIKSLRKNLISERANYATIDYSNLLK